MRLLYWARSICLVLPCTSIVARTLHLRADSLSVQVVAISVESSRAPLPKVRFKAVGTGKNSAFATSPNAYRGTIFERTPTGRELQLREVASVTLPTDIAILGGTLAADGSVVLWDARSLWTHRSGQRVVPLCGNLVISRGLVKKCVNRSVRRHGPFGVSLRS